MKADWQRPDFPDDYRDSHIRLRRTEWEEMYQPAYNHQSLTAEWLRQIHHKTKNPDKENRGL